MGRVVWLIEGHDRLGVEMHLRAVLVAVASAVGCAAGLPAPSQAAVTIGSDLSHAPVTGGISCGTAHCTDVESVAAPGDTHSLTAPSDGVVVAWRMRTGATSTMALRVVHPNPGGTVSGVATSAPFTVPDATDTVRGPIPSRLPIRAGDTIGLQAQALFITAFADPVTGAQWLAYSDFADGTSSPPGTSNPNRELLVNADIEPDADRDGFGDETQDACPDLTGSVNGCPKTDLSVGTTVSRGAESDLVTYTMSLANNGPDPALNGLSPGLVRSPGVTVSQTLPAGATVVPPERVNPVCGFDSRSIFCSTSPWAGASGSFPSFLVRLKAGANTSTASISSGDLDSAARRAAGAGDPNLANNTAVVTVNVAAPAVSSTKVSPKTFRMGSLLPKITRKRPVGTTISFKLSEPAKATLTFSQPKPGRRVGRRCVKPTRANRHHRPCTIPNVRGTLSLRGHKGTNRVRFQGRLSRTRRLKPGRYTLTITATDSAGNRSRPKSTRFTIVRG